MKLFNLTQILGSWYILYICLIATIKKVSFIIINNDKTDHNKLYSMYVCTKKIYTFLQIYHLDTFCVYSYDKAFNLYTVYY